ncbi:MAG: LysR substrate-binding domain-containing protein [Alphaproteobacteria bacterium]|nr:LysR substrate-binding domain-containing protein [Alphaproteobacteria bacterium]
MRLPPLNALRAFEAAARHQSFSAAAEELCVSSGAVSRHVKLLEEHLGVALFRRRPRGLVLTEAGRKLLPEITASFERIVAAAGDVSSRPRPLRVAAPHTFGPRWLVPRLARFRDQQPGLELNMGFFDAWEDFFEGNFDAGIACHESINIMPADLTAELIMPEALTPICLPAMRAELSRPGDLAGQVLLHNYPDFADWRKWLGAAGVIDRVDYRSGQTFESMDMAIQAALSGLGVAMGDLFLIRDELDSGRLVTPFETVAMENTGYYFFCQRDRCKEQPIVAFRDWIATEAREDKAALGLANRCLNAGRSAEVSR